MATSTVAAVAKMASFVIGLASIVSVASAELATTNMMSDLPDYFDQSSMALALTSDSVPVGVEYKIAPLTAEAGLNQTNENALRAFHVLGDMVVVDQTNYNNNNLNLKDSIAYLTCDSNSNDSYISSNDVLNSVMGRQPKAILLYSTTGICCGLGGSDLDFTSIWTMTDPQSAGMTKNWTSDTTGGIVRATISGGNDTGADTDNGQTQGGNNSAVAMSILYSITGLITLLFLIIIATGAIRAHRHPERYGPRASYGGRPRQSRAKGLARAVLETLPIVKFGDPQPAKPDPENELESISGDRQPRSASPTQRDVTSIDVEPENTSEVATKDVPKAVTENPVATTSDHTEESGRQAEEDHLGCSICTEDFSVGQDVRVLPCDHKFHPQCVDPWLVNVSGTCPLCRLDLRPREAEEAEESGEATNEAPQPNETGPADTHSAHVPEDDGDGPQRRRISRFLDWNRLRHASVDERILALRQYRESQPDAIPDTSSAEDQSQHTRLSDRLREKFHIRTRAHPPSGPASSNQ
ncbi:uncharacterized protein GGS22DRAFT_169589 [Annulohypoxylon maeteangense]|uniref:uncharacterized protein n=1 Tax=Annulohypoxylon maeteangense TaxID=1927788 RepID=UPI0020085DBC|nr:uncharacterized protein GGS22DRAFT_169589 [Annulohypoxylon maeteangense]KAI0882492.1 hypothetical protein GGS22DRAFT_169589 [Annulohypoxylon maeteangense]